MTVVRSHELFPTPARPTRNEERDLQRFAGLILSEYRDGAEEIEAAAIETFAERCGLIEPYEAQAPCSGIWCRCAETGAAFPVKCHRLTAAGREAMKAVIAHP